MRESTLTVNWLKCFFYLKRRNYMPRIGNDIKMGYYKTPIDNVGRKLLKLISIEEDSEDSIYRVLDPCCGEGEFLNLVNCSNENFEGYGVELDSVRFQEARKFANLKIEHAAYEQMVCSNNAFSLIYSNPPYQDELKPMTAKWGDDSALYTLEYDFLKRATNHLAIDGIHIFVVTYDRLTNHYYQDLIVKNYYQLGLCRLNDDEFSRFKQVVLFARKKNPFKMIQHDTEEKEFLELVNSLTQKNVKDVLPTLDEFVEQEKCWIIPGGSKDAKIIFYPKVNFREDYSPISGIPDFENILSEFKREDSQLDLTKAENRPKIEISDGQLGVLIMSGVIRVETGEGDDYHLAQGSEEVYWEESSETLDFSTKKISTQKRKAKFCIATPRGLKILK